MKNYLKWIILNYYPFFVIFYYMNDITNLLDEDLFDKEEEKQNVLLVDTHNLCMRNLFALTFDPTDTTFIGYKIAVLKSIRKIARDFNPNKIIFCMESHNGNWRHNLYPEYKANRKEARANSIVDFNLFFKENNQFWDDFKDICGNCQFLKIDKLEADDLIALTVKTQPKWNITLISTDKDFYQLHKYPNFKQWDPINDKYIQVLNPENALLEKIIRGDSLDNIPPIKKGIGTVRCASILNNGLNEWLKNNELTEAFERNSKLISFNYIPHEYNSIVKDKLDNFEYRPFDKREFFNFIMNNHLGSFLSEIDNFCNIFNDIK